MKYILILLINLALVKAIDLVGIFSDAENTSEPTEISVHSRAMFKSAVILAQQNIGWKIIQTGGNFISTLNKFCSMMSNSNIIGSVGPAYSREVHVMATFADSVRIPMISYAATSPQLSNRNIYPTLYRTNPSDGNAAIALTQLFLRYNWTSCLIIYQNDEFGSGGNDAIRNEFDRHGLTVVESIFFNIPTKTIRADLKDFLWKSSTRIIILWVIDVYTPLVLKEAIENDVAGPHFTWILRSNISFDDFDQASYPKLIGHLILEATSSSVVHSIYNSTLLQFAKNIWQKYEPETYPQSGIINDYGLYSFDATWTLIQALQQLPSFKITNSSSCYEPQFVDTSQLLDLISQTEFLGVSGPIKFNSNTTDRITGVYFILQNIQPFENGIGFTPVLQWSYDNQWTSYSQVEVLVWPGNSLVVPTSFAGLSGVNLKICVIRATPFTMLVDDLGQNKMKLIGYIIDLIDALKEKIGFISQINLVPTNQTHDNLVQFVANGNCDLAVADLTITAKRRELVDFSASIFDTSLRIIIRQTPANDVDLFSYLRPFSTGLWLTLLAGTVVAAILICFLERQDNEAFHERSIISSGAMSMWYSIGTIMGYGADFHVQTAAGRLLSVGLYLLSLVLVATYTANLASDLTNSKNQDIISGIEDIKDGKLPFSRIGIKIGSSIVDFYLREISNGNQNFFPLYSSQERYARLFNGTIDAAIADTPALEYATSNIYCNLTLVGADFDQSAFGIAMPKNWIYAKDLNVAILSLREAGFLDQLRKKWFQTNVCANSDSTNDSLSISIKSMSGLFFTFAVICLLSIVLYCWTKRFAVKKFFRHSTIEKQSITVELNSFSPSTAITISEKI